MSQRSASPKIIDAVLTVVSTKGLEATSVRTVASEAGVSIGAVQHHFATKSDLLVAAMNEVTRRFQDELGQRVSGQATPRERLRALLHLLAVTGSDEQEVTAAVVWTAFAARACVDPEIRRLHAEGWQQVEEVIAALVSAVDPERGDPSEVAATLLALCDGLAVARAAEPSRMPAERAAALVDALMAAQLPLPE